MRRRLGISVVAGMASCFLGLSVCPYAHAETVEVSKTGTVHWWLTSESLEHLLAPQSPLHFNTDTVPLERTIKVNADIQYQSILGLGGSLEHATTYNISLLEEAEQQRVIESIVHPVNGIGMNFMRISIGTSDFVGEPWYSYCEIPEGEIDLDLESFSIDRDRAYVIPAIKRALEINPELKLLASTWSPPAWMKDNGSMLAGSLLPAFYDVYARYLVRFVQAYEAEGIPIHAITPQNEPDYPDARYPTTYWTGEQQRDFVRDYLGPRFREAGLNTEIWVWDHNWHLLDFPRTILRDAAAAQYVQGVAFHLYEGEVEAQSEFHEEFPEMPIYFTEGSVFETQGAIDLINILRNWSRSYLAWVLMLDEDRKPNNGPHPASQTPLELKNDGSVWYNIDYYIYGQFMKYIQRDAVRIDSGSPEKWFNQIAFLNPDNSITLVVANADSTPADFTVQWNNQYFNTSIPHKSVATFIWHP